eukprot:INCI5399.4.p1 GENE.INCI5399.4~~INCI5399.4.p1  ORF type:complete len:764 (+),score=167.92 INCI5399.4:291-2582(+)
MDEESKRIIAKAARDHAKYEAQYAGLDFGSTSESETDTESTGSYTGDETTFTEQTTTVTGIGGPAIAASSVPAIVVTHSADDQPSEEEMSDASSSEGGGGYHETASQVKEVTKVASGFAARGRRSGAYNSEDDEDIEDESGSGVGGRRTEASYKETASQVKEVTKVAGGAGGKSSRDGAYNSGDDEDIDDEERRRRREEKEAQRRRDGAYEESASQVKEVTKVAGGGRSSGRRGAGYNSEDDEDIDDEERRRRREEKEAQRRREEEEAQRRRDGAYDESASQVKEVTKVAGGVAGKDRRNAAYNSEDDEDIEDEERRRRVEERRRRKEEEARRRRDAAYEESVSQTKEVTKVAGGGRSYGRRGAGYNSEDDEEFSSEGGFDASEESYGGHHFFEGGSGTKSSSDYSSFNSGGGGARRDEEYDKFGVLRGPHSGTDRRDVSYEDVNHSMGTSSVAGSSEAYLATAMTNETKTTEASKTVGLTPIQRAAKRAMERDSPYVPLADLIPAFTENPEGLKKALNTPVPYDHGVVQCTLRRRKRLLYFYLQPENRLLMIGYERNKIFSKGINVMISVVPQPQKQRHEPSYIGKVRSNGNFTEFWVYDGGIAPKLVGVNKDDAPPRRELAYVKYDLFPDAPRYMLVMTPRVRDDETWRDFVPHLPKDREDDDGSMEARYKAGHNQDIEVSYNRKPEWNEKLGRFELDIKNRAQLPSTKNFMISTRLDPNHDSVLMGKAADKVYTISVQYPMTLFQGLTIGITALYAKTYR